MANRDDYIQFGKNLVRLRDERGYTQSQFARLTGVPPSTLAGYETGIRKAPFAFLKEAARKLQVTTDELLSMNCMDGEN